MKYLYLILFFIGTSSFSQSDWDDFTGKEKAFLFHQARRVELLSSNVFHLFEFTDSIPYINDTLPDYRYVENEIVQHPALLKLHVDQFSRKSDGILSDLALRYSLWELGQVLQFRNSTAEEDKPLLEKLKRFEQFVLEEVPQSAVRTLNSGEYALAKSISGYYSASLTVSDKLAAIRNSGYNQNDQMLILNAVMMAEQKYVNVRTKEILTALQGNNESAKNYISAVGDGSNWAEIVGGFNTPYSIGLPDEKGLFKFTIEDVFDKEKEKNFLKIKDVERRQFNTNNFENTVVHVDVFGYHPERQTTIAIQKGGNSYVLYGKNEHRLVSPDSTYGEGTTYWRLMNRLEFYHIANLKEDLYGKRGYEYQIDQFEQKIEKTKQRIKETEYRLDKLRHTPEGKPKIKKKKIKKKDLGRSDQDGGGHPTSALSKLDKKKNIEQNRLVQLNGQLDEQKRILAKLKEDMEKAYINLVKYETKLDYMKKNMGYIIMEFEEENGVYTFKDGATFNYETQDFTFPPSDNEETFQIYHISFGEKVFDERIDENFAHIHVSHHLPKSKYTLKRTVRDDGSKALTVSDSIQIMEIFNYLKEKKNKAVLTVNAGGVVEFIDGDYARKVTSSIAPYDNESTANNGVVLYEGKKSTLLNLSVTVYDDEMMPANFNAYQTAFEKVKTKNPAINAVDFYTGIRAKKAAEDWVAFLKTLVPEWIEDGGNQSRILSKLKKLKVKKIQFINGSFVGKVPSMNK